LPRKRDPAKTPRKRGAKKAPSAVGDILNAMQRGTPLGESLEVARIFAQWPDIAGPTVSAHCQPVTIRAMQLVVEADNSIWVSRVNLKKWQIIRRMNQAAGRELVNSVFVILKEDDVG
jgi:hypothetical protein